MTYVEWLRVRGVLKWTAIVIAACIALVLYARFGLADVATHGPYFTIKDMSYAKLMQVSDVTHTVLPDGTKRTVIDNPKMGLHITTDDHGYWGQHIEIFEKTPPAGSVPNSAAFGDISYERKMVPGGSIVTFDTAKPEDLAYYFAAATLVALIVGTILAAPFARENDGHLEVALTKPIARAPLGLATMGVDLVGMLAAWVLTVAFFAIGHTIFEAPNYVYGPNDTAVLVGGLIGATAWYALLCAATASSKRAYGVVLGMAWPIAGLIMLLSSDALGDGPLPQVVRAIATPLSKLLPFSYMHFGVAFTIDNHPAGAMTATYTEIPILIALALVYGAVAIVQWRRVEA